MNGNLFDTIKLIADVGIIPLLGMIYSVQGRLSKIEGQFQALTDLIKRERGIS